MSRKTRMTLLRPSLAVMILLLGLLTACSALEGVGLPGGATATPEPPPIDAEAQAEAPEPADTPEPPAAPTPTAVFGAGDAEETPTDEAMDEEPTPTPISPPQDTPEGEETAAAGETSEPEEAIPLLDQTPEATTLVETVAPVAPASSGSSTYTVKAGDTLSEIAKQFGTTTSVLISLNGSTYPGLTTNPNAIEVGWVLELPEGSATYEVQPSDVLEEIAREHNTTVEVIITLNEATYPGLRTNPGRLEIGWLLRLP